MKKLLIALGLVISFSAFSKTPPIGWVNVPGTDVFRETTAIVHGNTRGEIYRAELWGWTKELGYIKITVGCSFDRYWIDKDGKRIVENPYDPGHQFWSIKKGFCY